MTLLVPIAALLLSVTLSGCGGGGGGPDTPSPVPTPPPTPPPPTHVEVRAVSFNMQWWLIKKNNIFDELNTTLMWNGPYDLMGFQECDDIHEVLTKVPDNSSYAFKQGPADIGIAWNTNKFKMLKQGDAVIAKDAYGDRYLTWARLNIIGTKGNIFFANAHGALNVCNGSKGEEVANNYLDVIRNNRDNKTDTLIFTGDFNCQTYDTVIKTLGTHYTDAAQASQYYYGMYQPDHIFTDGGVTVINKDAQCCALGKPITCKLKSECVSDSRHCFGMGDNCCAYPSDHQLLQAHLDVPTFPKSAVAEKVIV